MNESHILGVDQREHGRMRRLAGAVVAGWFVLAVVGSLLGWFDSVRIPPLALGAAAVLPVVAYSVAYLNSPAWRRFVLSADLRVLTLAQTWRVGGILFVILYYQHRLPAAFALPAGWGDVAIGATAPLVAWASASDRLSQRGFVIWHLLGLLDLVMAVTLGVLSSPGLAGVFAGEVTTRLMGLFPLSLIPTFFVPLLVILHLVALAKVRTESRRH